MIIAFYPKLFSIYSEETKNICGPTTRHNFTLPFGTNIHGPVLLFLGSYGADPNQVSVSGLSSGAYMTVQMQVAHSKTFMGAGVVAGGNLFLFISLLLLIKVVDPFLDRGPKERLRTTNITTYQNVGHC